MGLILKWTDGDLELALWHIDDGEETSAEKLGFTDLDIREWETAHHEKRKREWLASRAALRAGLEKTWAVLYLENGKPYCRESALSFSHCLPLAGALIHPQHAGFDIQLEDEKLMKIRQRFAHPTELADAAKSNNELAYVTILWSAKEAVFKVFGEQFTFAEHIRLRTFELGQSTLVADVEHCGVRYTAYLRHMVVMKHHVVLVSKLLKE